MQNQRHYEFTAETKQIGSTTLHRIRATRDLPQHRVKQGDLGGFVEKFENLQGNAWVADDACVFENSRVFENAAVSENSRVFGNSWVHGDASIFGNAWIFGDAWVNGDTLVGEDEHVSE